MGLANGILKNAHYVDDAATQLGMTSLDSIRNVVSKIAEVIDSDMDTSPVITPVLDLSQIQNGISSISGRFGTTSVGLSGRVSAATTKGEVVGTYNDVNVIKAIDRIDNRLNNLGAAISDMKMVLDTGTLVGEIAGPMNKQLKGIQVKVERGG